MNDPQQQSPEVYKSPQSPEAQASVERDPADAILERSLSDIQSVKDEIVAETHQDPLSPEVSHETNRRLVNKAMETLQTPGVTLAEIDDDLEDVALKSAIDAEGGESPDETAVGAMENAGFDGVMTELVKHLGEEHVLTPSGHEVAPILAELIDGLGIHDDSKVEVTQSTDAGQQGVPGWEQVHAKDEHEPSMEAFVSETLHRDETIRDNLDFRRPRFEIAGRTVVFRNRQEKPTFDDAPIAVIGAEAAPPLKLTIEDEQFEEVLKTVDDVEAYIKENEQLEEGAVIAVTNTPEGMLAAAAELTDDPAERAKLELLQQTLQSDGYTDEASIDYLDGIIGSVLIDDSGEARMQYDTDGFAVAFAALTGDERAQKIVDVKRQQLREYEKSKIDERIQEGVEDLAQHPEIEPLPLDQMALVHSTKYDIERNAQGDVILQSAANKREDKFPRASLHFTVNSQVGTVYSMGVKQEWDPKNKMIITNMQKAVNVNGAPHLLNGVDTWMMLDPGSEMVLPDALVIEANSDGDLISETEKGTEFAYKDEYSRTEINELKTMASEVGLGAMALGIGSTESIQELVKEVALRKTMRRAGVPYDVQDVPSTNGHGMDSYVLAGRIRATAAALGALGGKHSDTPEAMLEMQANAGMNSEYVDQKSDFSGFNEDEAPKWRNNGASLKAYRQVFVSGYMPSRPPTKQKSSLDSSLDPFGGIAF